MASIAPLLKGPTVIAYSGDPVAAPKVAADFAKANEKFVILGGAMGKTALDPNGVKALASLPSLDELRAKIVGLLRGAGDQDRAAHQRPGGQGRARGPGLCLQERCGVTALANSSNWFEPNRTRKMADLQKIVDELSTPDRARSG